MKRFTSDQINDLSEESSSAPKRRRKTEVKQDTINKPKTDVEIGGLDDTLGLRTLSLMCQSDFVNVLNQYPAISALIIKCYHKLMATDGFPNGMKVVPPPRAKYDPKHLEPVSDSYSKQ